MLYNYFIFLCNFAEKCRNLQYIKCNKVRILKILRDELKQIQFTEFYRNLQKSAIFYKFYKFLKSTYD